ncbi:MAG TPA: MaoC family dehydratase N-terminal domain-containing protein [Conexibacter sp.]
MPVQTSAVGKSYAPVVYAVGREKIKEYASATGETNPLHLDPAAARAAGYADVVAPPMFAVVYQSPSVMPALFDPEIGINFAMLVHSGQEFAWERVVVAGEELMTATTVKAVSEKSGMGFYDFEVVTSDQTGATVVTGIWKMLVRGS